jgi:hypothetical protein
MARSRRAAYYLRMDEQQKRPDQPLRCGWLLLTQKAKQKGKAARFMETETRMSFASKRQGTEVPYVKDLELAGGGYETT